MWRIASDLDGIRSPLLILYLFKFPHHFDFDLQLFLSSFCLVNILICSTLECFCLDTLLLGFICNMNPVNIHKTWYMYEYFTMLFLI